MNNSIKNKKIINTLNLIKKYSVNTYPDDIDPNEHLSEEQFIRILTHNYNDFGASLKEPIRIAINKHKYGIIVLPPSDAFNDDENEIYKLSKFLSKIESEVKGWVIDLRSNTGGAVHIFALFITIFLSEDYEGILWSIKKNNNDVIQDVSITHDMLHIRIKYQQYASSYEFGKLVRLKENKKIKILIDEYSMSGSEFVCLVLKSFGAKIYNSSNRSGGALNRSAGYLVDPNISMYFPNAYIYDKNNLKNDIYIESAKTIKKKYFLP